jgi:hypothetical protein
MASRLKDLQHNIHARNMQHGRSNLVKAVAVERTLR